MELTRRDFFKLSAAGTAGAAWATFGFDLEPAYAQAGALKISRAKEIRSVCPLRRRLLDDRLRLRSR